MIDLMRMIKRYKLNYLLVYILLFFTSCNRFYQIYQDNYDASEFVVIEHFYARNCELKHFLFKPECETLLSDSLWRSFKKELKEKEINLFVKNDVKNKINDSLWVNQKEHTYNNVRKIDTCYIKRTVSNSKDMVLVPVINYNETYSGSLHGRNYTISITLSLFLIKKNQIIYASNEYIGEETFFIGTFEDFDKSTVEVEHLWKEVVNKAIQPFIERLK